MTDHSEPGKEQKEELFKQFPEDQQLQVRRLWNAAPKSAPRTEVNTTEVDEALAAVYQRIGTSGTNVWKWAAAAAIILIVALSGLLWFPHSVEVPNGQTATHRLPDGSVVELNSGTELQYSRLYGYLGRDIQLDGEAFFTVLQGEHPFRVHTVNATVKVTGTRFNVRSWAQEARPSTTVTVSEGQVHFFGDQPSEYVAIGAGQQSMLTGSAGSPASPRPADLEEAIGWRDNNLVFNNQQLSTIFRELERRFGVTITLGDPRIGNTVLSAYYSKPKNVERVLNDICRVKGLLFTPTTDGYRIIKPPQ